MPKLMTGANVYEASLERIRNHYRRGDRVVLSFSGGKDSGVTLELLIQVAWEFGALPVNVVMRDEEIMYPGTFEYCERTMNRPEVKMHWLIQGQPIINAFNRFSPYWWVFDPAEKAKWVREPPEWTEWAQEQCIESITNKDRFPVEDGQRLIAMIGLRANESKSRTFTIFSSEGYETKHPNAWGVYNSRPIYDWSDTDVWKAINDFGWDYNHAYDAMRRNGCTMAQLRIAPPSMRQGMQQLRIASKIWPSWFDKVSTRLPGIRTAAYFGKRALMPIRREGETWEQCAWRCAEDAPPWFVDRVTEIIQRCLRHHKHHSTIPILEKEICPRCRPQCPGSWEAIANVAYTADPWVQQQAVVKKSLEPYVLREGAKGWYDDGKRGVIKW